MIARILPQEEWPRLKGTEVETLWPLLKPETARILVVEEDGEIVATWAALHVVHMECLWVAPEHKGSFAIARRLFKGMRDIATAWGVTQVLTGSASAYVTDLISRFGGVPMPAETFILPVKSPRERRADEKLGRSFHRQLAAQVVEEQHPEDPAHDEQVGRALRIAVEEKQPERAMDDYNTWARGAGYAPIKYLGEVDGRLRADIVTAVIEMDERYKVRVVEEASCRL